MIININKILFIATNIYHNQLTQYSKNIFNNKNHH